MPAGRDGTPNARRQPSTARPDITNSAAISPIYDFGACAGELAHTEAEDHIFDEGRMDRRPAGLGRHRPPDGWLTSYAGADPEAHTAHLAAIG